MPNSIHILSNDVLVIILDYLSFDSPKSLYSVSLASSRLHSLAQRQLYRNLQFTFARCWEVSNGLLLRRLEQDPDARSSVQQIYINWASGVVPRQDSTQGTKLMHQLVNLVPQLTSLRKFIWDAQCAIIPRFYKIIASYCPSCELYTRCPSRSDIARSLQLLQHSPQVVALEITLNRTQFQAFSELRKVLVTCTNLRQLQLACLPFPNAPNEGYWGVFTLCAPGRQLPPLRVLKLQQIMLADYSQAGWEWCLQWEALECLQCMEIEFFPKASASLKGLRSLRIHLSSDTEWTFEQGDAVLELATTSSKLKELCLTGMTDFLRTRNFLSRGNPSIRHIKIHENQIYGDNGNRVRSIINRGEIEYLGHSFPRLERCSIDLEVRSEWPWDTLSQIAESLWYIVELELNLELHLPPPSYSHPVATFQSVRRIWDFVWQNVQDVRTAKGHTTCRPRLRTLRVVEGSYRQTWDISQEIINQECREQATFEARLSERDDLAERGHADVVCLELEGLYNKYGRGPQEDRLHQTLMQCMISRAQEGPVQQRSIDLGNRLDLFRPLRTPLLGFADTY